MSKLYKEISDLIEANTSWCEGQSAVVQALNDDFDLAKAIEKIVINAQIELLKDLRAAYDNGDFVSIAIKANQDLQKQLEQ